MNTFWFITLCIISIILIFIGLIAIRDGVELKRPKDVLFGIFFISILFILWTLLI